jgi:hypothetical protein
MELNISEINIIQPQGVDKGCFDWCAVQHVTGYNNIETGYVMFIAGALALLLLAEYFNEKENLRKYTMTAVYLAKLLIYIFFFAYFVVLKMRLYYWLMPA